MTMLSIVQLHAKPFIGMDLGLLMQKQMLSHFKSYISAPCFIILHG